MACTPRRLLSALAVLLAAGCATAPPQARSTAAPVAPPLPPGSDWREVPRVPFGARLEELHVPLHEVLLFRDRDEAAAGDERECYAPEDGARRFLGREADGELICLRRGRVDSVELRVLLPAAQAPALLAGYCEAWQRGSSAPVAGRADRCSGADPAGMAFEASLGPASDDDEVPLRIVVHDNQSTASP